MHYALIRPRKGSSPDSASRSGPRPRQSAPVKTEQTVGDRLRAKAGPGFTPAWLAQELGCSVDTATELAGYWIPQGPPHLLEQTLNVFANALELDAQRLHELLRGAAGPAPYSAPVSAPRALAPRDSTPRDSAPRRPAVAGAAPRISIKPAAPAQAEISIGSAEGVRVVRQRQPTIVYRKVRKVPVEAQPG